MDFFVNDRSFHGQFSVISAFREAIGELLNMRSKATELGHSVSCGRSVAFAQVTPAHKMAAAVQALGIDERRILMSWLTKGGPFWDDSQNHPDCEYLACGDDIVTGSAVGEAAFCCMHELERQLLSLSPSDWTFSPVQVQWCPETGPPRHVDIMNYWNLEAFSKVLCYAPASIVSWDALADSARERFTRLRFLSSCFEPLQGTPFSKGVADRILSLLGALENISTFRDQDGKRSPEGHSVYHNYFVGSRPLFTDSSESEKQRFRQRLTFRDSERARDLFCTWHAKINTPPIRIHFSWPLGADESCTIAYVGPKITKV